MVNNICIDVYNIWKYIHIYLYKNNIILIKRVYTDKHWTLKEYIHILIYVLLNGEHIHTNLRKIEIYILPCSCPNYILSLYTKHFVTINLQMYEVGGSKMMGLAPFFLFSLFFLFLKITPCDPFGGHYVVYL